MKIFSLFFLILFLLSEFSYSQSSTENLVSNYLKGEKFKYSTGGHAKSNGIDIEIEIPIGWTKKEGERPHIIQSFTSKGEVPGSGYSSTIQLNVIPKEYFYLNESETAEILFDDFITQQTIPEEMEILSIVDTKYDGQPGQMIVIFGTLNRSGIELLTAMIMHRIIYEKNLITIMIGYSFIPTNSNLEQFGEVQEDLKYFTTLAKLIGNSIIIRNKWSY